MPSTTITEIDYWRHKLHQARVERRLTLDAAAAAVGVTRERFELVEYRRAAIRLTTIRSWWAQIESHQHVTPAATGTSAEAPAGAEGSSTHAKDEAANH